MNIGLVSLGCSKNQVDAERMLFKLENAGYTVTPAETADVVIINTCGFIAAAKEEAIETILEFIHYKSIGQIKKIVVTGCLAQRYFAEIQKEFPEVDAVLGLGSNNNIAEIMEQFEETEEPKIFEKGDRRTLDLIGGRTLINAPYYAYLKISEGCSNCCTYCAIPSIRGAYRSVPIEELLSEAEDLIENGVTELILVAQDTTMYGVDLYGECKLPELLEKISKLEKLHWLRVLYTYPERITDKLLDVMANNKKIIKYLDIPIQHCNSEILKKMNRSGDKETLIVLIEKIRRKIPGVVLRTSIITGFPGETEEQFTELAEFVKNSKFERLGCFPYSQEEGTKAATFPEQIDEEIKERRAENIMDTQSRITENFNEKQIGKILEVITESYDDIAEQYCGRSKADAPDIDCKVYFTADFEIPIGSYVNTEITDYLDYDLIGVVINEETTR